MPTVLDRDRRWAFIHTPKAGGSWIMLVLRDAFPDVEILSGTESHLTLSGLRQVRELPEDIFTFSVVRSPLTWYWSWWRHWTNPTQPLPDGMNERLWRHTFEKTLRNVVAQQYPLWSRVMLPHTQGIDRVIRFEVLRPEFRAVLAKICPKASGRLLERPPRRTSPERPLTPIPADLFSDLIDLERPGMENLGYSITPSDRKKFCDGDSH